MKFICGCCGFSRDEEPSFAEERHGRMIYFCRKCWENPVLYFPGKKMHPKYLHLNYPNHELSDFAGGGQ